MAAQFALLTLPAVGELALRRRIRRMTPAEQVAHTMRLCGADPRRLDPTVLSAHIELAAARRDMPHAEGCLLQAARSLMFHLGPGARTVWSAVAAVRAPTLVLHGAQDRLVPLAAVAQAMARRPDWYLRVYPDLGHVPMLQDPARVAADIAAWLPQVAAATAAR